MKRLDRAKQRLSDRFDEAARRAIVEALLEDALALCESVSFLTWWVVSDDEAVIRAARARGLEVAPDPGDGLNAALRSGIDAAIAAGADSATVVPVDVPLAFKGDLEDLLDTGATSDVVLVPSETDGGTNALYLSPPAVLEPHFGPQSLRAHLHEAERKGLRCSILNLPRLALDLDTPEDADQIVERTRFPNRTSEVLAKVGAAGQN